MVFSTLTKRTETSPWNTDETHNANEERKNGYLKKDYENKTFYRWINSILKCRENGPYVEGNNAELRLRGATPLLPHTFEWCDA
jgi:hypothetical protein